MFTNRAPDGVYPGEFIPLPEGTTTLLRGTNRLDAEPLVNVVEYADHYRVDLCVPGANREDILMTVTDHVLSISVVRMVVETVQRDEELHEFEELPICRRVLLPRDADTAFVSAQYNAGIVHLYVPKANGSLTPGMQKIALY